jgi:hypothetical protein
VRGRPDGDEDDGSQEEGVAGRRGAAQDPARSPTRLQAGGRQASRTAAADRGREVSHPAVPERLLARIARRCPPGSLAGPQEVPGIEIPLLPTRGCALAAGGLPPRREAGQGRGRGHPPAGVPGIHPQGRTGRTVARPPRRSPRNGRGGCLPAGRRLGARAEASRRTRLEAGHHPLRSALG